MDTSARPYALVSQRQFSRTAGSRRTWAALLLTLSLAGCSIWDLGPQPSTYVGASRSQAQGQTLTDPGLRAVQPRVPGDEPGGAAALPGAVLPATLPAATQPVTTQPAGTGAAAPAPETTPALGKGSAGTEVPESLSVQDAILVGLQNNTALRVQKYNVPIRRASEEAALSAFDPTVSGTIQGGRTVSGGRAVDAISANASVTEFLPTGTTITGQVTTSNNFYSEAASNVGANVSVTQALLRGAGLDVNLASLREAELATKVSQYELRAVAESLVASIEQSYWDLAYAERQVVIVQNALDVAQRQLDDTNNRINVGGLSASERPAAEAEVALRRENLINAKSALETARMNFLQLLAPASRRFWEQKVTLTTLPFIPPGTMDPVDGHVDVALRMRPEVNQSKLQIQRGDLEIVRTKNGLLPRLDLFVTLGETGFAKSFGESVGSFNGEDYQALLGVRGDWSPINRSARASYRAAELSREQLQESLDNLVQTVQLDVRTQYIEVERTRQQIDASRATRISQEQKLEVEQGKLRAGSGRSLDVAIAQRDLLSSQLSEVQSVTSHLKALVTLYRLEGTLLLRRGIDAPGATGVKK